MSVPRRALLIVDHGSRNENANRAISDFASRIAEARPDWRVAHAHMELAQPDVPSTIDALVGDGVCGLVALLGVLRQKPVDELEDGVHEIHVHLHFLGRGYHVRETIPELMDAARARHEELRITISDPIGEHPRLVEIVLESLTLVEG